MALQVKFNLRNNLKICQVKNYMHAALRIERLKSKGNTGTNNFVQELRISKASEKSKTRNKT